MTYTYKAIEGQRLGFEVTTEHNGEQITFNVGLANDISEMNSVVQAHLDFLNRGAQTYTPTYADLRRTEYPSVPDQLDILYHGGYDAWKQAISDVKAKYPKPNEGAA